MKIRSVALVALMTAMPAASGASDAATLFPGFRYITDHKAFVFDETRMTPEQKKAIERGRILLAEKLKKEIRGKFSVAEAAWGFQINCEAIESRSGDAWKREIEGFGEIFLSKDLATSKIDYGP